MMLGRIAMLIGGLRRGVLLALTSLTLVGVSLAEPVAGKIKFRLLSDAGQSSSIGSASSIPGFRDSFIDSFDTSLTDPIENLKMKRAVDQAYIGMHRPDEDPDPAKSAAHTVLSYQLRKYTDSTLKGSDLRESYRAFTSFVRRIERSMKVTVEDRGEGYAVSRKPKGKRLLDFGLELSTNNLIEPVMRIGEVGRFRYDVRSQAPMVEMGIDF